MHILVLGSGGREHTFVWKLSQSKKAEKIYIAPGNAGTSKLAENVDIALSDFSAIEEFVISHGIGMLLVGPEQPLVDGITDYFRNSPKLQDVLVIGPSSHGAKLEGSKDFAKSFMEKYKIPTAKYKTFTKERMQEAVDFMKTLSPPYVLKADGLAAGKGVVILDAVDEAEKELQEMFSGKFGEAGNQVVIEEFLSGIELSVFVLTDGENYVMLPEAKDYKRIGKGDTGPNTGGMGSVSPVPFAYGGFLERVEEEVVKPTIKGIHAEKMDYIGFVFIGLMNCQGQPKVIEYNVRMGDPETQSVIPRIKNDFLSLLEAAATKKLEEEKIRIDTDYAATVVLVSEGYPGSYKKGEIIEIADNIQDSRVFHAGTKIEGKNVVTNGGRVLNVTSMAGSMQEALDKSFKSAEAIKYKGRYYRDDIGFDIKSSDA